jgi:alkanesulfonate monooxygenase SsuD/methylene tetrahydromethanopterin reductase-like flavin-dependent oxidoreductase (luciferase family)
MPSPGVALDRLGFLTIGLFDGDDPGPGHRTTLEIIELGERLGFDSAWVRHRHLQYGISSPVAILAAASQRTTRIELGTAVIPLGWENPLRLAEDLATVDVLSGGRGEHGMNFLTSSVIRAEESEDFAEVQQAQVRAFRAAHPAGDAARVSQGLVVIPTDTATPAQRAKYQAYVQARTPRTARPQGPARMMFAPDLLGSSGQMAEALYAHAGFREVREVAFALPFSFDHEDYVQILSDLAGKLGPALGWHPKLRPGAK